LCFFFFRGVPQLVSCSRQTPWTVKKIVSYAKKYAAVLDIGDASPLHLADINNQHEDKVRGVNTPASTSTVTFG
jgi:hypothetical protein